VYAISAKQSAFKLKQKGVRLSPLFGLYVFVCEDLLDAEADARPLTQTSHRYRLQIGKHRIEPQQNR
jgi:hypothetical protein